MVALSLLFITKLLQVAIADEPLHRKFEYKHSFRAPDLALRDGTIPFWTIAGDAVASSDQLRLAPSLRSRKGLAFNKRTMSESDFFEIDVAFRVMGQGRIGADGIGIWYTAQQPALGPVFGANDYWTGMGLFLDSFDNDAQKNNPFIALMINDGTRQYDHQTDGSQQMLSGCQKDFRNKPYPVHLKVTYYRNVLTVMISDGLQASPRYEMCIRAENIFLPKNGYFGLSAATGGLADDHDIVSYSVYSLYTEHPQRAEAGINLEEKQKYDAEFQRQLQEYERERQKFKELHPEKAKPDTVDEEIAKMYEDAQQRELRLIYEMQSSISQVLINLEQRVREIAQQQNVHYSVLQQCAAGHGGAVQAGGAPPAGGFLQHEKNEALQTLRDLTSKMNDVKSYVTETFTKISNLQGGSLSQDTGTGQTDLTLRPMVETIQNDVRQIRAAQLGASPSISAGACPNVACVTTNMFMVVIILQSIAILGMLFVRIQRKHRLEYIT